MKKYANKFAHSKYLLYLCTENGLETLLNVL